MARGTLAAGWLISIHPPRVGRDQAPASLFLPAGNFNPPSPCGEGPPAPPSASSRTANFNPPSPCGEGQQKLTKILCKLLR